MVMCEFSSGASCDPLPKLLMQMSQAPQIKASDIEQRTVGFRKQYVRIPDAAEYTS
jgi:hypothetical protein